MRYWILFGILVLAGMDSLYAQEKCSWISAEQINQPILADSLSLIEESIRITDHTGANYKFTYNLSTNELIVLSQDSVKPDSVQICYETLAVRLGQPIARRTLL